MRELICALSVLFVACGSPDVVTGDLDSLSQGLKVGPVIIVRGTYRTTCLDPATGAKRPTGATWILTAAGSSGSEPRAVQGDSQCVLDVSAMTVTDSGGSNAVATPTASFALGGTFLSSPIRFSYNDSALGKPVEFFANMRLAPADFSSNFVVTVIYSDSPDAASPIMLGGSYSTSSSSLSAGRVVAPATTLSFSGVTYTKSVSGQIASVAGNPMLTPSANDPATLKWVATSGACPSTLAGADSAYRGGMATAISTPPTSAQLGLAVGATAPITSCLLVANCDAASSVCAYQEFAVTFN